MEKGCGGCWGEGGRVNTNCGPGRKQSTVSIDTSGNSPAGGVLQVWDLNCLNDDGAARHTDAYEAGGERRH